MSVTFSLQVLFSRVNLAHWGVVTVPRPELTSLDLRAVCVSALAFGLLFGFKRQLGVTLLVCGALGALLKTLT